MKRGRRLTPPAPILCLGLSLVAVAPPPAPAAAASASATATILGLVHPQTPASEVGAVEGAHGVLGSTRVSHLDEAEASRPAGVAIHDHVDRLDLAVTREHVAQFVLSDGEGKISHV